MSIYNTGYGNPIKLYELNGLNDMQLQMLYREMTPVQRPFYQQYQHGPLQDLSSLQELAIQKDKYYSSAAYLAKSAKDKQSELWSEVMSDTSPGSFPSPV